MKITAYSAAISSLLTTPSGQLGMGSRHPELELDQAYMFEVGSAQNVYLNLLNGEAIVDDVEQVHEQPDGEEVIISRISQIHIRNTGKSSLSCTLDFDDEKKVINDLEIPSGGEIALFVEASPDSTTLDLVSMAEDECISAKVFVSGKR